MSLHAVVDSYLSACMATRHIFATIVFCGSIKIGSQRPQSQRLSGQADHAYVDRVACVNNKRRSTHLFFPPSSRISCSAALLLMLYFSTYQTRTESKRHVNRNHKARYALFWVRTRVWTLFFWLSLWPRSVFRARMARRSFESFSVQMYFDQRIISIKRF